jgi:DinB superfamily
MKKTIERLEQIVGDYGPKMSGLEDSDISIRHSPGKWTRKEILGHLIDSAQNNLRRFVVAQYETIPTIIYQQDSWVSIANYAHAPAKDLVALWKLLNEQICRVLKNTSAKDSEKLCMTNDPEPHSIAWLAEDYIKHLLHHLHQILRLDPAPYP